MAVESDLLRKRGLRETLLSHNSAHEFGSDARDLVDMFLRRKVLFALITALGVLLAAGLLLVMTPLYTATTTILVTTRHAQVVDLEPVLSNPSPNPFLLQSQLESEIELIRSYPLVSEVVDQLDLVNDPEFNPLLPANERGGWTGVRALFTGGLQWVREKATALLGAGEPPEGSLEAQMAAAEAQVTPDIRERGVKVTVVANVQDQLVIAPRGRSTAISISFTSTDPQKAAAVVDALAGAYVRSTVDVKTQATRDGVRWLNDRVVELRTNVAELKERIEKYRLDEGLAEETGTNVHGQKLSQISGQLLEAEIDAKVARERLDHMKQIGRGGPSVTAEVLGSPLIQTLRGEEAILQRKSQELEDSYGPRHPQVLANNAALQGLRRKIDAEVGKIQQVRENELSVAQARVALLQDRLGELEQETGRRKHVQLKLHELEVEAGAKQRLYEAFLRRHHEVSQQLDIQQPDARIIAPARPPLKPSFPRKTLFLSCAVLISMILAASIVVTVELLKRGFKSAEDVEQTLQAPMLGIVPRLGRMQRLREKPEDYLLFRPSSLYSESIRGLRTSLRLLALPPPTHTVLFTSALPHEGKTAIAMSFARMAARAGQRVVLIDCDLRRTRLHKAFGNAAPGLTDYLEERARPEDIIQMDESSGLNFITGGGRTSSPAELLERPAMAALLQDLGRSFDLIVLDSPPVLSVADTRLLAELAHSTVLVVEWDRTSRREARLAYNMLRQASTDVVGVVLSKADPRVTAKYGYYTDQRRSRGTVYLGA